LSVRLFADENKDSRQQRQNTQKNTWYGDGEEGHETDDDQVNRQQQHSDVFGEVHGWMFSMVMGQITTQKFVLERFKVFH
jgi:hypothetical protein